MLQRLRVANSALAVCLLALVGTLVVAYPLAGQVSMAAQIAAHIGTLLFATGIKVAYILRLVSLKALGRPVH
ncbi:hypothetical protein [Marinobacter mobilis]|uniref:Uncharacterized protein n=1 Tax=Marinobacter mobilis TaxID=488533 RepID=A0A1H2R9F4_9GAMM|nr:hypothetical protein [Marinobacter mobilis]SDW15838.1 hypothetical protein SAMN04487960_101450 [Marinobacter mobilis]